MSAIDSTHRKSPLHIIIVGGGIGGLFTAIALRSRCDYSVTVLEKNSALRCAGGTIALQPSAVRIIKAYGLGPVFEKNMRVGPEAWWRWRRYNSGELLAEREGRSYKETFGCESWSFSRQRLLEILGKAVVDRGVEVRLGCRIVGFEDCVRPCLTLENGDKVRADVVVGADGIHSFVRGCVILRDEFKVTTALHAWMVKIPLDGLESDPDILPYLQDVNFWLGPGRSITSASIPQENVYNMTLFIDEKGDDQGFQLSGKDFSKAIQSFGSFNPFITKILTRAQGEQAYFWRVYEVSPLRSWRSKGGRIVLLGDSAHAMVPFAAQGASQCIEDAVTLAECLSHHHDGVGLGRLLQIYEEIRKPRAESVAARSAVRRVTFHLADGSEQQERDRKMQKQGRSYKPDRQTWNGEHIDEPPAVDSPLHDPYLLGYDAISHVSSNHLHRLA
ncbi:hypothetical protein B0J12DRAFT_586678 [Macrophomina phaseolina]|uniref:FAD-binding domain-containing protein n=1 Tax=Macrophomina phaseolina TaxID=35725 RepID=A0ABQ8FTL0_9PEZI|nr:hypothetical protein B0J12DRAFT_586678 [Macrophomina phaseolina]